MKHPIFYEIRRWSFGQTDYHSVRVKTQERKRALTVPLAVGRDAEGTVLQLLRKERIITDLVTNSLRVAAGESGYRVVMTSDEEVLRRRELHDYGIGELK